MPARTNLRTAAALLWASRSARVPEPGMVSSATISHAVHVSMVMLIFPAISRRLVHKARARDRSSTLGTDSCADPHALANPSQHRISESSTATVSFGSSNRSVPKQHRTARRCGLNGKASDGEEMTQRVAPWFVAPEA